MPWTTTVPAAITQLVTLLSSADALAGVAVFDSLIPTEAALTEAIIVAYGDEQTPAAVEQTFTSESLGVTPTREQYRIQCSVQVLNGSSDMPAARTRAYALLGAIGDTVAANNRLGRLVLSARLSEAALHPAQGTDGALAQLVFSVDVDAYSGR